jgi:hypothetical protein
VHSHEPAARTDEPLERSLLRLVEDVVAAQALVVKTAASSVASTWMRFRTPSPRSAWTAVGIESWRKPAVFVKRRIRSSWGAAAVDHEPPPRSTTATASTRTAAARIVGTTGTR